VTDDDLVEQILLGDEGAAEVLCSAPACAGVCWREHCRGCMRRQRLDCGS